jgi:hypothetical protein
MPIRVDKTGNIFGRGTNRQAGRRHSLLIACGLLIAFAACDELPFEREVSSREFLIRTGEHYSTPRLMETFQTKKLAFKATFDETARYQLSDASLQDSKNKLMGFSDCNSLHHENSARFAWQWFNDRLEIYAYCYVDSIRVEQFVAPVHVNEENLYEIATTADEYIFYLNGAKKAAIGRTVQCNDGLNYILYPYFGGTMPAPHDVRIEIQMVK